MFASLSRRWAAPMAKSVTSKAAASHFSGIASSSSIGSHNVRSSCRLFSSQEISETKTALLEILSREEKEEEELENLELPEDLMELKTTIEKSWKIVENNASTDLFKIDTLSNNKIQVSFHCQDTIEDEQEDQNVYDDDDNDEELFSDDIDNDDDDDDDDMVEEEEAAAVRFTVTVTNTAGKSLVFACFSELGKVCIDGVSTGGLSTPEYIHENQGMLPKTEYQGPDFSELAPDLRHALGDYLDEECGVNSDVGSFIAMFTDYREEVQYVNFLKQVQLIV